MRLNPTEPTNIGAVFRHLEDRIERLERAGMQPVSSRPPRPVAPWSRPSVPAPGNGLVTRAWATEPVSLYRLREHRLRVSIRATPASSTAAATLYVVRVLTIPGFGAVFDETVASATVPGDLGYRDIDGIVSVSIPQSDLLDEGTLRLRFDLAAPNTGVAWSVYQPVATVLMSSEAKVGVDGLTVS